MANKPNSIYTLVVDGFADAESVPGGVAFRNMAGDIVATVEIAGSDGGAVAWGGITGEIAQQTDLTELVESRLASAIQQTQAVTAITVYTSDASAQAASADAPTVLCLSVEE